MVQVTRARRLLATLETNVSLKRGKQGSPTEAQRHREYKKEESEIHMSGKYPYHAGRRPKNYWMAIDKVSPTHTANETRDNEKLLKRQ